VVSIRKPSPASIVSVGMLLVATVCAIGGCSRSDDAFAGVDQAVADVDLGALGKVIIDQRTGTGRPLSQPPTRRLAVITTGPVERATDKAASALQSAGFSQTGVTGWQRSKDGQFVQAFVTTQGGGSRIEGWDGVVGPDESALIVTFTRGT
jgi:hypothetical protein